VQQQTIAQLLSRVHEARAALVEEVRGGNWGGDECDEPGWMSVVGLSRVARPGLRRWRGCWAGTRLGMSVMSQDG